jgi:hypothetical protein
VCACRPLDSKEEALTSYDTTYLPSYSDTIQQQNTPYKENAADISPQLTLVAYVVQHKQMPSRPRLVQQMLLQATAKASAHSIGFESSAEKWITPQLHLVGSCVAGHM